MRNPKWHRDEIILALDLYFKLEPGKIHAGNPQVIELSEVINQLPIFDIKPDELKFRNPNGVSLKLSNFLAIDDSHDGKGMSSYSKLDAEIFYEFIKDKELLSQLAKTIKTTVNNSTLKLALSHIENNEEDEGVKEGQVLYKLHKLRERNKKIVSKKKAESLKKLGKLECEICSFDFHVKYGELGYGFIECHHKVPLHALASITETKLDDLALVCSNCHRMLHSKNSVSISDLKIIQGGLGTAFKS